MVSYKRNSSRNDFITHLEISPVHSNNLGCTPPINICVRGLPAGVWAPGPLSFFFNKLLTFAPKAWYNIIEHLREIQYENKNTLQTRRFQTQSCHALNVWIRYIKFGNFQQNSKKSKPNNSHGTP